jgi:hypothetical protein
MHGVLRNPALFLPRRYLGDDLLLNTLAAGDQPTKVEDVRSRQERQSSTELAALTASPNRENRLLWLELPPFRLQNWKSLKRHFCMTFVFVWDFCKAKVFSETFPKMSTSHKIASMGFLQIW